LPSPDEMMTSSQHNLRVALPFCHIELKTQKTITSPYPTSLTSLGDHIRKKRLDLGLFQKDVAKIIGTSEVSVYNWENNYFKPYFRFLPKIINFLGYMPYTSSKSIGEKLSIIRRSLGLSQNETAKIIGVDPSSISDWEQGTHKPKGKSLEIIERFFNGRF